MGNFAQGGKLPLNNSPRLPMREAGFVKLEGLIGSTRWDLPAEVRASAIPLGSPRGTQDQ